MIKDLPDSLLEYKLQALDNPGEGESMEVMAGVGIFPFALFKIYIHSSGSVLPDIWQSLIREHGRNPALRKNPIHLNASTRYQG